MKKILNTGIRAVFGLLLVLPLVWAPSTSFAKDKDKDKDHDSRGKNTPACFRLMGITLGAGETCQFPFGLGKKFILPPDTTAPQITSFVSTKVEARSAVLRWTVDERSSATVFYGTGTLDVNAATAQSLSLKFRARESALHLKDLAPNTTYHAIVRVRDVAGNTSVSNQITFTTLALETPDTKAPVISDVVAIVGTSSVKVGWKTNEAASAKLYYGVGTPVNTATASVVQDTTLSANHVLTVANLSATTTYYFVLESKDAAGNVQKTDQFSLKTGM